MMRRLRAHGIYNVEFSGALDRVTNEHHLQFRTKVNSCEWIIEQVRCTKLVRSSAPNTSKLPSDSGLTTRCKTRRWNSPPKKRRATLAEKLMREPRVCLMRNTFRGIGQESRGCLAWYVGGKQRQDRCRDTLTTSTVFCLLRDVMRRVNVVSI